MRPKARNLTAAKRSRGRNLRKNMSISERVFWEIVRKKRLGFLFRTQHSIGDYTMDFYCPAAGLCLEIDGEQHANRKHLDERWDGLLLKEGIVTIRIPSLDIFRQNCPRLSAWIALVVRLCEIRTS